MCEETFPDSCVASVGRYSARGRFNAFGMDIKPFVDVESVITPPPFLDEGQSLGAHSGIPTGARKQDQRLVDGDKKEAVAVDRIRTYWQGSVFGRSSTAAGGSGRWPNSPGVVAR